VFGLPTTENGRIIARVCHNGNEDS
jgi:hypothetical protein